MNLNPGGLIGGIVGGAVGAAILFSAANEGGRGRGRMVGLLVVGGAMAGNYLWGLISPAKDSSDE